MTSELDIAILRSILYADVFDFPMTCAEIRQFLIHDQPVSIEAIEAALAQSSFLHQMLSTNTTYIALRGRESLIAERKGREAATERLWPLALRYGAWLGRLPFVRMVALTGALAVRNSPHHKDDLDFLLVTRPGRVWLARAFAILMVRWLRLRGITLCPNYLLDETVLEQAPQDLFIAHQIAQMIPISGHESYWRFRAANLWTETLLANAQSPLYATEDSQPAFVWKFLQALAEAALKGPLGDWLETWEQRRKLARFADDLKNPRSSAQLDAHRVKGHFSDYGQVVLGKYNERLREYQLDTLAPLAEEDPLMADRPTRSRHP